MGLNKVSYSSRESIGFIQNKRDDAYVMTIATKEYYVAYYAKLRALKQCIGRTSKRNITSLNKLYRDVLREMREAESAYGRARQLLKSYSKTLYILKRHERLMLKEAGFDTFTAVHFLPGAHHIHQMPPENA